MQFHLEQLFKECNKELSDPVRLRDMINLGKDLDLNTKDDAGNTCLYYLCKQKKPPALDVIKMLLEGGASPNSLNINDYTALHMAFEIYVNGEQNNLKIIELLLDYKANPNLKEKINNDTCLRLACRNWFEYDLEHEKSYFKLVKLLIENGADPTIKSSKCSYLFSACAYAMSYNNLCEANLYPNLELVTLMLKYGSSDVKELAQFPANTLLSAAIEQHNYDVGLLLLMHFDITGLKSFMIKSEFQDNLLARLISLLQTNEEDAVKIIDFLKERQPSLVRDIKQCASSIPVFQKKSWETTLLFFKDMKKNESMKHLSPPKPIQLKILGEALYSADELIKEALAKFPESNKSMCTIS